MSRFQSRSAAVPRTPKTIEIAGRKIGPGRPTFVIAEIGVNHDGNINKALELVRIAASCGADAIKLQIFRATTLMHPSSEFAEYQKHRVGEADPVEMLRKYELSRDDLRTIVRAIVEAKLVPIATPFSPADMDTIAGLRLPAIKIASPDLVNYPLLFEAVQFEKPLLISTGASTMDEVRRTAGWMNEWAASHAFLHCISSYPVMPTDANLSWVTELDREFNVPIGYSDHTSSTMSAALSIMAGACIIEKHLTYDQSARGPDHSASADPAHFERYVKLIREADTLRGISGKCVLDAEKDVRRVSRQSLVLKRSLKAGEVIRPGDLTVQRPAGGISAADYTQTIGRTVNQDLTAGVMLQGEMLQAGEGEKAA